MQRPLQEHIFNLEQRIEALKSRIAEPDRAEREREEARIDLGIAERSLLYFRKAYELERRISKWS